MVDTPSRAQGKRRLVERALELAGEGRWEESEQVNRDILARFPRDFEAMNRLGKAFAEQHRYSDARDIYQKVLEIEPTNPIARKNVARMELLSTQPVETNGTVGLAREARPQARQAMFIEEPGQSRMLIVESAVAQTTLSKLISGDHLELRQQGESVGVYNWEGEFIGFLPARVGHRLSAMMENGNQYQAAVAAVLDGALRIVVRETFHSPENSGRLSFPTSGKPANIPRAYTRDVRRPTLEPGLYDDDTDDDEVDDEEELEPDAEENEIVEDEELIDESRRTRDEDEIG
ncbi:MAG: tetratricopeptide repeat protein [Thermomicrobia bacterium]|nr:tetratricopeptide repeat protein [Thermomicrobia bacterium]